MPASAVRERSGSAAPEPSRRARVAAIGPADVALAFTSVSLVGSPPEIARGCVDALARVVGSARLVVPRSMVPIPVGDGSEHLRLLLRFDAGGENGEVWSDADAGDAVREAVSAQLSRIWTLVARRAAEQSEVDGLRFHLASLQQVTHTLAEIDDTEQAERLALDFVREICFSWWAVLYRKRDDGGFERRVRFATRGEAFPEHLPPAAVRSLLEGPGSRPVVPGPDHPLRGHVPPDVEVVVPFTLGDAGSGILALGPRMTGAPYSPQDLSLVQTLVDASAIALRNTELIGYLRTQAIRDALTGCQNRRGFDEILQHEMTRARRYGRTLSLVLFDLDHFKTINDEFGHDTGDHVLRRVGRLLLTTFRSTDTACRPGGEEFAMIFPETPLADAARLAERLREDILRIGPDAVLPRAVSASFGVAAFPDDARDIDDLIRVADRALYLAKAEGRNRVVAGTRFAVDAA
jgi:diguanylate cyclase (GGDEF)-like protein